MRAAAIVIIIFASLGLLGFGGTVVFTIATKGWFDQLIGLVLVAGLYAVYLVIGLASTKRPRLFPGVLGMLLVVPLVGAVAALGKWNFNALLIIGGVPALLLFIPSLVLVATSRKAAPPKPE